MWFDFVIPESCDIEFYSQINRDNYGQCDECTYATTSHWYHTYV